MNWEWNQKLPCRKGMINSQVGKFFSRIREEEKRSVRIISWKGSLEIAVATSRDKVVVPWLQNSSVGLEKKSCSNPVLEGLIRNCCGKVKRQSGCPHGKMVKKFHGMNQTCTSMNFSALGS
ncbi:hypothetical protein CDAR_123531 [Caerostris darwini]|uniref:Uncharacterized protein n=1 Tax=Caerostris darwini TaxID=1538125 RepID=A0AAV4WX48_9ARAC|nr:hypothetical protein CDAR_123531 [Caerostris darwini]